MTWFQNRTEQFQQHFRTTGQPLNLAEDYGIEIWFGHQGDYPEVFRAIGVYHLAGHENNGNHNLYVDLLDKNGDRMLGEPIEWFRTYADRWERAIVDKPPYEPGTNIALFGNGIAIEVKVGIGLPTDTVRGFTSWWADEDTGNTLGHHSFFVVFQLVEIEADPPPDEPDPPDPPSLTPELTTEHEVYVRGGPSVQFEIVETLPAGAKRTIIGLSEDENWWVIPQSSVLHGYIYQEEVTTNIPAGYDPGLPIISDPDLLPDPDSPPTEEITDIGSVEVVRHEGSPRDDPGGIGSDCGIFASREEAWGSAEEEAIGMMRISIWTEKLRAMLVDNPNLILSLYIPIKRTKPVVLKIRKALEEDASR